VIAVKNLGNYMIQAGLLVGPAPVVWLESDNHVLMVKFIIVIFDNSREESKQATLATQTYPQVMFVVRDPSSL